jgi:hypothetical protein
MALQAQKGRSLNTLVILRVQEGSKRHTVLQDVEIDAARLDNLREYGFEGIQEEPRAWVDDWVLRAQSFQFEID